MNPTRQKYTPGHTASATAFQAARDLDTHGFFLTPLLQPGFDVLDAGCGPGTITTGLAQSVFPGHVTAFDVSQKQLDQARRNAQGREIVNLDFVAGNVDQLPFADEAFHVVFAHALLEHLHDPMPALNEFHRVTKPGGFLGVCSPDWDAIDLTSHPVRVDRAIQAYRTLQDCNGGNTRAGKHLADWMDKAGFTPLMHDLWYEEYEDPATMAEYLAVPLDLAGQFHHANNLRTWAASPEAGIRLCWRYATGIRADGNTRRNLVLE